MREHALINVDRLTHRSDFEKYDFELSYEDMTPQQQDERRESFCMKMAEFLFAINRTIQMIMLPKIYDKVIDGRYNSLKLYRH